MWWSYRGKWGSESWARAEERSTRSERLDDWYMADALLVDEWWMTDWGPSEEGGGEEREKRDEIIDMVFHPESLSILHLHLLHANFFFFFF